MQDGIDPLFTSQFRIATAALALNFLAPFSGQAFQPRRVPTIGILLQTAGSGFLSMAIGMTLLLFALSGGEVGIVSTLSATTQVVILPLLWLVTKERPAWGAWGGSFAVVIGMAMLFSR